MPFSAVARHDSPNATQRYLQLQRELTPLRDALVAHPMYAHIGQLSSLRAFMSAHVFAVWDFMSLLKTLQDRLTCTSVPWLPRENTFAARLINDIVLGEETDEIAPGRYLSHFDLYLEAMTEVGAETSTIEQFIGLLRRGASVTEALDRTELLEATKAFVHTTMATTRQSTVEVAASFLLGREALVPNMFEQLVARLHDQGYPCAAFRTYLERHIHVDSEQHGPMAQSLLEALCGTDEELWQRATASAYRALDARRALWDGVLTAL